MARMFDGAPIPRTPAVQRAVDFGVDVTLLLENLKRSPTERVRGAQRTLESALAFADEAARSRKRGALDLLGEMQPFGGYERVAERSERIELFGRSVQVLKLEALIEAKRAAGRRKDLLLIPELEALLELRKRPTD